MLPGPYSVYTCPTCGNLIKRGSLMSGNTYGAKYFSDGKRIAPMLPDFPNLSKCKKCNSFFWLDKLQEIGTSEWDDYNNTEFQNADTASFLEINDYYNSLKIGIAESQEEERFIRQQIWWSYNDRIRSGNESFTDETDELRWKENASILIALLDLSDITQKIMVAELYRNLGDFEACIKAVNKIDNEEFDWLKEIFIKECSKRNRWVIELG